MSEQKHTPGPWKSEYREKSLAVYQRTRSGAKTGRPICVVSRKDAANAHLIAAAPELLQALKQLKAATSALVMGIVMGHTITMEVQDRINASVDAASTAIAKVEGRS